MPEAVFQSFEQAGARQYNLLGIKGSTVLNGSFSIISQTPLHWHEAIEFLYIRSGIMIVHENGRETAYHPGDVAVINSGTIHQTKGEIGKTTYLLVIVPLSYLREMIPNVRNPFFSREKIEANKLELVRCMQSISKILEQDGPFKRLEVLRGFAELMQLFYGRCLGESGRDIQVTHRIKDILGYIHSQYAGDISLDTIAKEFGLQKNYFCRWFKKNTGYSYHRYISEIRLGAALSAFVNSDNTVLQCAVDAGFASEKVMIDWCRKIYGCTPTEYRDAGRVLVSERYNTNLQLVTKEPR